MAEQVDFSAAEQLLREAEFLDCRPVWYSSNYFYLAQLCAKWEVAPQDVLRALGGPDAGVFEPAWLRRQPIWQSSSHA